MVSTTGHEPKNGTCAIAAVAAIVRIKYIRNISANGMDGSRGRNIIADTRKKKIYIYIYICKGKFSKKIENVKFIDLKVKRKIYIYIINIDVRIV